MFESDDYDQILSQVDLPELGFTDNFIKKSNNVFEDKSTKNNDEPGISKANHLSINLEKGNASTDSDIENINENHKNVCESSINKLLNKCDNMSPKHMKRKIINSYFDHNTKRKFPGPAGLLSGTFKEKKDDDVCHLELFSQDVDFTQNYLQGNVFESPLWKRLLEDTASFKDINSIKAIKHQALVGNLQRRKAKYVVAIVESIDRSAIDPLVTLRDSTGNIKCTLHRDAWTAFSTYIASEICAIVLCKPTVLTTGSAFKKHYLNITLSNILTIYSSAAAIEDESLPDGFQKICEEDCTIIKTNRSEILSTNESLQDNLDFLDDLDNAFLDEMF